MCLELLMHAGVDVNNRTPNGQPALTSASGSGFDEGVQLLIRAGACVNTFCHLYDETPLMAATSDGYANTAKLLLQAGADVNICNSYGQTALMNVLNQKIKSPFVRSKKYRVECVRRSKLLP